MNFDGVGGRNKTHRKNYNTLDLSGALALGFYEKTFQMLSSDADTALKRPWHKLDRGLRIGRIRDFTKRETDRLNLNQEDSDSLFKLLIRCLDKKLLNSKATVTYEPETTHITEIKGLVAHTTASGTTKFSYVDKKPATTQRRRVSQAKEQTQSTTSENDTSGTPKNEIVQSTA